VDNARMGRYACCTQLDEWVRLVRTIVGTAVAVGAVVAVVGGMMVVIGIGRGRWSRVIDSDSENTMLIWVMS
jgi:hypothetical protein